MKKVLFTLFACFFACSAGATHYKPITAGAVKRLAHDDKNLYILHFDGLEVRNKATGETLCYTQATGHIPEGNIYSTGNFHDAMLNAIAVHGDTVWVGGNGFLTAIVGQEAESWHIPYDITISNPSYSSSPKLPMSFNCIEFDSKGTMYLGGIDQVGYLQKTGKASFVGLPSNGAQGTEVWQVLPAADGGVWVSYTSDSGNNSLARYTAGDEEVEEVSNKLGFRNQIKAMAVDGNGCLWFGVSRRDVNIYRYDGVSLETFDTGVSAQRGPCCMTFDDSGRLWLLYSNSGKIGYAQYSVGPLYCFMDGDPREYPFPKGVGMAYCLDVDGDDVYVGTDNGVLKLADGRLSLLDTTWYSERPEETAVKDCKTASTGGDADAVYDLQGRRRSSNNSMKGIYIRNVRKILRP